MRKLVVVFCCCLASATFGQKDSINIAWDRSISMENRQIQKDFQVLDSLFGLWKNVHVRFVDFSTDKRSKSFDISNANWSELKTYIKSLNYSGTALYNQINDVFGKQPIYIFSDLTSRYKKNKIRIGPKSVIVNSNLFSDQRALQRTALISRAKLIDYSTNKTAESSLVNGVVFVDNIPTPGVQFLINGLDSIFNSNSQGIFGIPARIGDSVLVTSRAYLTSKWLIVGQDFTDQLFLKSGIFQLDEVILTEEKAFGFLKGQADFEITNKIGVATQKISGDDFGAINTDVGTAVQGRFSGVQLNNASGSPDLSKITMRTQNSILLNNYGLVVIDGVPQQQSSSVGGSPDAKFDFIDPNQIAEIEVLKGLSATNRYGSLGSNGVILITTKSAKTGTVKSKNSNLNKNTFEQTVQEWSTATLMYYSLLSSQVDLQSAINEYFRLRQTNAFDANLYLQAAQFFMSSEQDELAINCLSSIFDKFGDPLILKSALLQVVSLNSSSQYYKNLLVLSEAVVSSLNPSIDRDYLMYQLNEKQENFKDAYSSLESAETKIEGSIRNTDLKKIITRDKKDLVSKSEKLKNDSQIPAFLKSSTSLKMRVLFQWNNPLAAFDISIVNPSKQLFTFEHATDQEINEFGDEVRVGGSFKEFEFYDDSIKGEWQFLTEFKGNLDPNSSTPLLLLCTFITDFGSSNQTKEQYAITLNELNKVVKITSVEL